MSFPSLVATQSISDLRLTANFEQQPLAEAIEQLESQLGLRFSYLTQNVKGKRVNCRFVEADWPKIKACLFTQNGIAAELVGEGDVVLTLAKKQPRSFELCLTAVDETGTALPFVTLQLPRQGEVYTTDLEGQWRQRVTGFATDSVQLQYLGYTQKRLPFSEVTGPACQRVTMEPGGIELASVVVTEYLTDGISATSEGRPVLLQPQHIPALPGFSENEVYRALNLLPGINNPDETAGGVNIRGGARDQNQILWDGIPVYATGHYFGMVSLFAPELIDEVRVWRGPADAAYGGRLAGVVEMNTAREVQSDWEVGAGATMTHAYGYAKIPLLRGQSDVHLGFRSSVESLLDGPTYASYRDQVFQGSALEAFTEDDDELFSDTLIQGAQDFRFEEFNGRWQWNPDDVTAVTVSGFSQFDDFTADLRSPFLGGTFEDAVTESNWGLALNLSRQLSKKRNVRLQATRSDFSSVTRNGFAERRALEISERSSSIVDQSIRLDYDFSPRRRDLLKLGFQWQRLESQFALLEQDELDEVDLMDEEDQRGNIFAGYGTYTLRPGGPWQAEIGVRMPFYSPTQQLFLEPRLALRYRLDEVWLFKAGFGINHQFSNEILDLDFDQGNTTRSLWVLGDEDEFEIPQSRELTLGVLGRKKGWLIDIEAYWKQISGISTLNLIQGAEADLFTSGSGRNIGVDILLKRRMRNWRTWAIYTLSTTENRFDEIALGYFPAANDLRHQLKWINTVEAGNWLFSLGWRIRSGTRFSSLEAFSVQEDPENDDAFIVDLQRGNLNDDKLGLYHRLDFSVFYNFKPKPRGLRGRIGFSALNLYNQSNVISQNYLVRENEDSEGEEDQFVVEGLEKIGLLFTPNISITLSWH